MGRLSVYLHPGKLHLSGDPCTVTTILGSCVAVCLWDPGANVGGINHYLLPYWVESENASPRFGNIAIRSLIDGVLGLGADATRLRAKIFGGACVLTALQAARSHLGDQNIDVARKLLGDEGIRIVGSDVGGQRGRKLLFNLDDGEAWVKLL